jgi:hypothetical protein
LDGTTNSKSSSRRTCAEAMPAVSTKTAAARMPLLCPFRKGVLGFYKSDRNVLYRYIESNREQMVMYG